MIKFLLYLQFFKLLNFFSFPIHAIGNAIKFQLESEVSKNFDSDLNDESNILDMSQKYYGVYVESPKELELFRNGLTFLGWFDTFDNLSNTKLAICVDSHRYVPFITLEPQGMELSSIAEGMYDERIIKYLQELSFGERIKNKVFIRFAHEMEMRPTYGENWYSWQGYDGAAYIRAWRHVVNLSKKYAPNVYWVWSPNRADLFTYTYYPGSDYVDFVSLTLNNTSDSYKTFGEFYESNNQKNFLESYNKPIIFGEVAEHCLDSEQKQYYLASVFDYIKDYDQVVGVIFFNKNVDDQRQYCFSDNNQELNVFNEKLLE